MCLKTVSWCRIRCDVRSYLAVVYSGVASGVEQIVCLINREVLEVARMRFVPFLAAAPGTAGAVTSSGRHKTRSVADDCALAAFFMSRARGLSTSDAVFWSNRPIDAIQVGTASSRVVLPALCAPCGLLNDLVGGWLCGGCDLIDGMTDD